MFTINNIEGVGYRYRYANHIQEIKQTRMANHILITTPTTLASKCNKHYIRYWFKNRTNA